MALLKWFDKRIASTNKVLVSALFVFACLVVVAQPTFNSRFNFGYATGANGILFQDNNLVVCGTTIDTTGETNYNFVTFFYPTSLDGIFGNVVIFGNDTTNLFTYNNSIFQNTSQEACIASQTTIEEVQHVVFWRVNANLEIIDNFDFYLSPYNPGAENEQFELFHPDRVIIDFEGNFYAACSMYATSETFNDFVIMKLSPEGELIWQYIYATESSIDNCFAMEHDGEGLWVAAGINTPDEENSITKHLFRLVEDGLGQPEVETEFFIDLPNFGFPRDMFLETDGIVLCGGFLNDAGDATIPVIAKVDYSGIVIWYTTAQINYNEDQRFYRMIKTTDGGYLCAGSEYVVGDNIEEWLEDYDRYGLLVKFSDDGSFEWQHRYKYIESCFDEHFIYDLAVTPDGGYVFCGESTDSCIDENWEQEEPNQQGWVVKVDACGCLVPGCDSLCTTDIQEFNDSIIQYFIVGPNPAAQFLNIYFAQDPRPNSQDFLFQLHDITGKLVSSFEPKTINTTYMLDMEKYESGTYVLSLIHGDKVLQSEKIVTE